MSEPDLIAALAPVVIYVLSQRAYDREAFHRRGSAALEDRDGAVRYSIDTPEDTILHKLEWYRSGGEISERQWRDVLGILKVQAQGLDLAYMRRWAAALDLADLLERALREATEAR